MQAFLRRFSISQKIDFSFYVTFATMAVLIALPFILIDEVNVAYRRHIYAYEQTRQAIYAINDGLRSINAIGIESALSEISPQKRKQRELLFHKIRRNLALLQNDPFILSDEELRHILWKIKNRIEGYFIIADSIRFEIQDDIEDGIYAILALSQADKKISRELNFLMERVKSIHEEKIDRIQQAISRSLHWKIALIAIVLLGLFVLNKVVARTILDELHRLHRLIDSFFDVLNKKRKKAIHIKIEANDEIAKMAERIDENIAIAERLIALERDHTREIEQQVAQATREIKKLNKELHATQKEIIHRMGVIAEEHSKETGLHIRRVANYSYLLAKLAGLDFKQAILLRDASPMHDIGKLGIPDAILNKPSRFDEEEFEIMKRHTTIGYNMLKNSKRELLRSAAIVAYEHHEHWDGRGYPRGLKGEEIHIYGRITAIADVFDALATSRVYKPAWSLERIVAYFREKKAKQFDPKLTELFLENIDLFVKVKQSIDRRENDIF